MKITNDLASLYEIEYDQWLEQTITVLKQNQWEKLDKDRK
jgi:hypothetical protein